MNPPGAHRSGPGRWAAVALALCGWALTGCGTAPSAPPSTGTAAQAGDTTWSGRLVLKAERPDGTPNPVMNAQFDLSGNEHQGSLRLSTPLGTTLADARWSRQGVLLVTEQGLQHFDDLEAMSQAVFSQNVPLPALWHWLQGQPWPARPATALSDPRDGFSQDGWVIRTRQLASNGLLTAQHDGPPGQVILRLRLDR